MRALRTHRRRPPSLGTAGVALLLGLLALTACGGVDLADTGATGAERRACESLVGALPGKVADLERRETDGTPLGAAWGDPAITLRCGVPQPKEQDRFSACQTVDGLDWFAPESATTDQSADVTLTTVGREPRVELVVPAERRPPAAAAR